MSQSQNDLEAPYEEGKQAFHNGKGLAAGSCSRVHEAEVRQWIRGWLDGAKAPASPIDFLLVTQPVK
jgi:hypothetical protein